MGKSSKGRTHVRSSYPYKTSRVGQHVRVVRPRARRQGSQPYYISLFAGRQNGGPGFKGSKLPELKRLSFVRAYSVFLSAKVAGLYSTSRNTLPGSWQPRVRMLEDRVASVGLPVWANVHTTSDRLLWQLDCKVNNLCEVADSFFQSPAALTEHASDPAKLDDMEAFRQRMIDAFAALAASPPVTRVLEGVEPSREYLAARYQDAHHAVVASQAYSSLLCTLHSLATRLQGSHLASAMAQRLYSLVSPVADPTLEKITSSPMYKDLVEHLKPVDAGSQQLTAGRADSPLALPTCYAC